MVFWKIIKEKTSLIAPKEKGGTQKDPSKTAVALTNKESFYFISLLENSTNSLDFKMIQVGFSQNHIS